MKFVDIYCADGYSRPRLRYIAVPNVDLKGSLTSSTRNKNNKAKVCSVVYKYYTV